MVRAPLSATRPPGCPRVRTVGDWVEVPFEAQLEHEGLRLDAFLTRRLRGYSRASVQRLIAAGQVRVESRGLVRKPAARLSKGDRIVLRYPRREEPPARHAALPVLYEDDDLLAVGKPGDILSHPTDRVVRNSATSILRGQFPDMRLHLGHRLDRETSGALLFAKHPAAARALTEAFTRRRVEKEYWALVAGRVLFEARTVDLPLGREGGGIKVRQAAGEAEARTEFHRLAASASASLVRALPKTGRLHQIRVHAAWLGHSVVGDKLYTGRGEMYLKAVRRELSAADLQALGAPRQMLHARRLSLAHPVRGTPLEIVAPLPPDFKACMEKFALVDGGEGSPREDA